MQFHGAEGTAHSVYFGVALLGYEENYSEGWRGWTMEWERIFFVLTRDWDTFTGNAECFQGLHVIIVILQSF